VIRIEGLHEWIGGPAVPSPRRSLRWTSLIISAGRSLLVALPVPLRGTFRWLGEKGRRIEGKNHRDKKSYPQHWCLSDSVTCVRKRSRGFDSILKKARRR
jgi:hypothetical protein